MKIFKICLGVILAVAAIFFIYVGVKAGVNHTAYKDELVNVFKGQAQEVQKPNEDNKIETEKAVLYFNI